MIDTLKSDVLESGMVILAYCLTLGIVGGIFGGNAGCTIGLILGLWLGFLRGEAKV